MAEPYVVHEIDRLSPTATYVWPKAINNQGQVVGYGDTPTGTHGFVWDLASGITDLDDLPGGQDFSTANDINDAGQIVGVSDTVTGQRGVLWDTDGSRLVLGDLPGGLDHSEAVAINSQGQIAGTSKSAAGPRPFIWDAVNGMQDLGNLPGMTTAATYDMNNASEVVGVVSDGNILTAFKWNATTGMQDLGDLPTGSLHVSYAYAINDDGFVAGRGNITEGDRAVLWRPDGEMLDLGIITNGINSYANDINQYGQIVGDVTAAGGHRAAIWNDPRGLPVDLNDSIDPASGWLLIDAYAINDVGQIIGMGISPGGLFSGFVISPQPAVTSIWPSNAAPGETLFIFGSGFVPQQSQVSINGVAMNLVQWMSPNLLLVRLPTSVTSGAVAVTTDYGSTQSPLDYGSLASGLNISGIWPGRGKAGDIIFVFGAGFSDPGIQLRLNAINLYSIQVVNDSLLLFILPAGAESGALEVITQQAQALSQSLFIVM